MPRRDPDQGKEEAAESKSVRREQRGQEGQTDNGGCQRDPRKTQGGVWRRQAKGVGMAARLQGLRPDRRGCARIRRMLHRCDAQVCTWSGSHVCLKTITFAPVCQWVNKHVAEQGKERHWWALLCAPGPSHLCLESEVLPHQPGWPELSYQSRLGRRGENQGDR